MPPIESIQPRPIAHVTLLLLTLSLYLGCGRAESHTHSPSGPIASAMQFRGDYPIRILCTTGQVAEMVARVGGKQVESSTLMGPRVDPHLFRPVPSDIEKLHSADVVFYCGLHLEGRMSDLFVQMARSKPTFAVTERLLMRSDSRLRRPPEFEGMVDPHVWHDPSIWADCVKDVADILGELDPAHAEQYQTNANQYAEEIRELHDYCQTAINTIPKSRRVMITAHDAFSYFGKAFGMEVYGLKGISSDAEKDLAHQDKIQSMILQRKIPAVFVESAIAPRTIGALVEPCRAAGWDLQVAEEELFADALGDVNSDAGTYAGMIRHNVDAIVKALSQE